MEWAKKYAEELMSILPIAGLPFFHDLTIAIVLSIVSASATAIVKYIFARMSVSKKDEQAEHDAKLVMEVLRELKHIADEKKKK